MNIDPRRSHLPDNEYASIKGLALKQFSRSVFKRTHPSQKDGVRKGNNKALLVSELVEGKTGSTREVKV